MMEKITAEYFLQATGYPDSNDDLERVNCPKAGQPGHTSCGWNWSWNRPVFEVGPNPKPEGAQA